MNGLTVKRSATGFYPIYSFMERELGLRGSELRVYAILFSFTCGQVGMYYGTRKYLADTLSISVRTLYRALDKLFMRGLIENTVDSDIGRSGLRCSFVHEGEMAGKSNTGSSLLLGEIKEKALDKMVVRDYGKLPDKIHLAARAAIRDRLEREHRERELNETVSRIRLMMKSP